MEKHGFGPLDPGRCEFFGKPDVLRRCGPRGENIWGEVARAPSATADRTAAYAAIWLDGWKVVEVDGNGNVSQFDRPYGQIKPELVHQSALASLYMALPL